MEYCKEYKIHIEKEKSCICWNIICWNKKKRIERKIYITMYMLE